MKVANLEELINEEIKTVLRKIKEARELQEEYLDEGGYSRLVRSLAGLEPNIESIGIITAENPMAQALSRRENKLRNIQLANDLREMGYGFYQIRGKYGNLERPFVIPNIEREDIVNLGEKYGQDSVIWVIKTEKGSLAELIETHGDQAVVRSRVILPLAADVDDFYSIYKGRKFVIPFFDDLYKDKEMVQGKIV